MLANSTSGRQVSRSAFSSLRMNKNCIRFFLACLMLTGIGMVAGVAQTITTDKPDYAPLSNAVFSGYGFGANEPVLLKVKNITQPCNTTTGDSSYAPWTVMTDNNGYFQTNWTVCNCAGDSLKLRATGQSTGFYAEVLFSDDTNPLLLGTIGTPVSQNFNGMGTSSSATTPIGFKIGTDWGAGAVQTSLAYGTTGTGSVTGTSGGGTINWANGITGSSTDRALGFLNSGSFTSPQSIVLKMTNNTGATITSLDIAFDYEKYRTGTREFNWDFFHGNTTNPTISAPAGDQNYPADAANAVVNPPTTISKSFSLSNLSIPAGASYYLKWTLTGVGGATNGQGLAIDNFSVTPGGVSCNPPAAPEIMLVNNCNGTTTLSTTASGTLNWSTGSQASSITVSSGGTYSVTATVDNCTSLAGSITISTPPNKLPTPTISANGPLSFCQGGSVTLTSSATSGNVWSTGATSRSITVSTSGDYSVSVQNVCGVITSVASTVSVTPALVASKEIVEPLCAGGIGLVKITASGGNGSYSGIGDFQVNAGQSYNFTVTSGACSQNISGTMSSPTPVVASSTYAPIFCKGGTSTVTVAGTGGTGDYGSTVGTFITYAGSYSFTVVDDNGCSAVTTGTIIEPIAISITELLHKNVSCSSGSDGEVILDITGGTKGGPLVFSEDFNSLQSSGSSASWSNATTIANWYASINGSTPNNYIISSGTSTTGGIYSFGVAGVNSNSDRAFGSIGSNSTSDILGAWKLTNTSAQPVTSILVTYTGEQWRNGGNTASQSLLFDYLIDASDINTGNWIRHAALDFTSLKNTSTAAVLDGNDPSNSSIKTSNISLNTPLLPGHAIWLRWTDENDAGNDHGLAIDDLSAIMNTGTTEPYTYSWSNGTSEIASTKDVTGLAAGTYTVTVKDGNNCVATKTVTITQPDPITTSESATACDSYTWPLNGQVYTTTGTYTYVYQNANGCNVTASLVLTINKSTTSEASVTACDQYVWHDVTYTMGGDYTYSSTNAAGCPHVETLHLTINNSTTSEASVTACDQYVWHDVTFTMGGDYTYSSTNAAGCPHVETLHLTINNSTTSEASVTACDQYVWHGVTYTMGGDYTYSSTNAAGCPHIETLHLTINKSTTSEASVTACDQYVWHGVTYTMDGDYIYSSTNAAGCPHVETLHLTINKSTTSEASVTACDQYVWHDVAYTMDGDYTYSSTNAAGCPHVETLHLTINKSTSHTTTITVCTSYTWSGPLGDNQTYTEAGTYTHTSTNADGCTHTEKLILSINPPIVFSATAHQPKCAGDKGSVTLGTPAGGAGTIQFDATPTTNLAPGTYTYTAIDELGCASSVSVVIDPAPAALVASASAGTISCFGGTATVLVSASGGTLPYSGTGSFVVGAGPYAYPVTDGNGCVSTASGNISQPNALSIVCSNSNPNLYYGYINGQSTIIKGSPIGGKAPYTVSITMNRKLVCDSVTASGDEFWTPSGGTSSNNICSTVNSAPVSTLGGIAETGSYSLEATLMKNATFTITVTDANGCTATCSTFVKAEDVRCFSGNSGNAKIAICHKTGSTKNPCTAICVDQSALAEHLAHGDYMGSCTPNCVAPAIVAAAATTVEHHDADEHATKLELKVMNNPAFNGSAFKLRVLSNNQQELIHLKVMDMNGRPVESKNGIRAGQTIEIGRSYIGGMYVVEAIQAGQRVVVKLIRQ